MIFAFYGCSGSGKTTLINEIKKWKYFNGKKVVVKKEDDFLIIRILKGIFGEKPFSEYKDAKFFNRKTKSIRSRTFSFLVSLFYPVIVYLEFLFDYIYYEIIFKQKILLRDRYIYDYLITFKHNLKIHNKICCFFYMNFPRPYLLCFFNISKETALKRNKNDFDGAITSKASFHEDVIDSYCRIAKTKSLLFIDSNDDLNASVDYIKSHISNKEKLAKVKKLVICGLDGSGKTTLANLLCEYLTKLNIRCKIVHFYYDSVLYKLLKKIGFFPKNMPQEVLYEKSRRREEKVKKKGKPFIWALLHFLDSYIQYLFFTIVYRNNLLIFDRFFYDFLVSFEFLNIRQYSVFERFLPSLEYSFLLVCNPEIIYRRKPENTLDFFKYSHQSYLKLASKHKIKVIDVSNSEPSLVLKNLIDNITQ